MLQSAARNASTGAEVEAEAEVEVEAATGTMVISVDSPTGGAAAAAVEVEADPVATTKSESLTGNPENVSAPGGMTMITAAEARAVGTTTDLSEPTLGTMLDPRTDT